MEDSKTVENMDSQIVYSSIIFNPSATQAQTAKPQTVPQNSVKNETPYKRVSGVLLFLLLLTMGCLITALILYVTQDITCQNEMNPTVNDTECKAPPEVMGLNISQLYTKYLSALSKITGPVQDSVWEWIKDGAVNITLDSETAHRVVDVSENLLQCSKSKSALSKDDTQSRFKICHCVLGKESFSSGRYYYEVQVNGKPVWDLGVMLESVDRSTEMTLSPQKGLWTLSLRSNNYTAALNGSPVLLPFRDSVQTLGIYVNYEDGQVSFYSVETKFNIYSFTGYNFTKGLYPYFYPGEDELPINISLFY